MSGAHDNRNSRNHNTKRLPTIEELAGKFEALKAEAARDEQAAKKVEVQVIRRPIPAGDDPENFDAEKALDSVNEAADRRFGIGEHGAHMGESLEVIWKLVQAAGKDYSLVLDDLEDAVGSIQHQLAGFLEGQVAGMDDRDERDKDPTPDASLDDEMEFAYVTKRAGTFKENSDFEIEEDYSSDYEEAYKRGHTFGFKFRELSQRDRAKMSDEVGNFLTEQRQKWLSEKAAQAGISMETVLEVFKDYAHLTTDSQETVLARLNQATAVRKKRVESADKKPSRQAVTSAPVVPSVAPEPKPLTSVVQKPTVNPSTPAQTTLGFSSRVQQMFNQSIEKEYVDSKKNTKNIAQKIHSYGKRTDQIRLLDDIRKELLSNTVLSVEEKEIVFYHAMKAMMQDLNKEHRATRFLGTKSRLEHILEKDMKVIKEALPDVDKHTVGAVKEIAKRAQFESELLKKFNDLEDHKNTQKGFFKR